MARTSAESMRKVKSNRPRCAVCSTSRLKTSPTACSRSMRRRSTASLDAIDRSHNCARRTCSDAPAQRGGYRRRPRRNNTESRASSLVAPDLVFRPVGRGTNTSNASRNPKGSRLNNASIFVDVNALTRRSDRRSEGARRPSSRAAALRPG